jgi:protein-S-isoprenylcysteine O-methyltransferase Ste14
MAGRMPASSDMTTTGVTAPQGAAERGPGVTVPPTVAFLAGFALAWWLHQREPLRFHEPGAVPGGLSPMAILGWVLLTGGIALFLWGLRTFFLARTGIMLQKPATVLMMSGPYSWSRNPQYVAFTAIYAGVALVANTLWPLLLLPPVLAVVVFGVIDREERYLRATFGREYDDYCSRVPRWI